MFLKWAREQQLFLNYKQFILPLRQLVEDVGEFQLSEITRVSQDHVETKDLNSLVSYVDQQSEVIIVKKLKDLIPDCGFITEEGVIENSNKEYTWVIDPLDGTTNYLHQIPHFSISIALKHNDEVILGVVYDPSLKECFWAVKGQGAYLNDRSLNLDLKDDLSSALIVTGFPYSNDYNVEAKFEMLKFWLLNTRGIRRLGSAALDLVYVASGRLDAYYEGPLNIWDLAAGALIAEEAGAKVSDLDGSRNHLVSGNILATNKGLYDKIFEVIKTKN